MLRTRLFLNLLPFVVILLAMGAYAAALLSRLASKVDETVTQNYQSIRSAYEMDQALADMDREALTRGSDKIMFAASQKRFEELLALQLKDTALPGKRELNEQLSTNYHDFLQAIATLSLPRSPKDTSPTDQQAVASRSSSIKVLLGKIRELNSQAVMSASLGIQKTASNATRLMIIGMVVVLAISAYACYQLSRSILQPIQLLTKATRELGAGNLDQPMPVTSRDELGDLAAAFNKMAAQLKEYRQSTSEEIVRLHRTMESTLASFPDPIFVLNHEGQVELKNPAAGDLAAGLQLNNQLPGQLQAIARKALERGANFLPDSFNEAVCYRVNAREKYFLPRVLAMRDKENVLFGVAVVLYDVTRFRLLDGAKTNLVATVSHELKTPLTSVRMALHILLEKAVGNLTPKQDELLQAARDDTERLLRILNDLLDLARLDEGNAELRREKVTPSDLLQSVIEEAADKISSRGLKMRCIVDTNLRAVSVDRQRISHVFTNFIANAIKHSPVGGEILLRATRAGNDGIQFNVTDQGQGVPEEYQIRIFDRFFRVPGQTKTGAGLGLSIAKEITVAHGGRIGVSSAPGQGSTFFVVLKAVGP